MGIAAAYIHPNPSSINKDHFFGKIHRPLQLDFGQDFALKSLPWLIRVVPSSFATFRPCAAVRGVVVHMLVAESAFDAQMAFGDGYVQRRSHFNNPVVLHME